MIKEDLIYEILSVVEEIPEGRVASYGQIALLCGNPKASRAVGYALHHNPMPGIVPCHRVVNARGETAPGWTEQAELLRREGVFFRPDGRVDRKRSGWRPWEDSCGGTGKNS